MKRFERQGASGTARLLALMLAEAILLVGCSNNGEANIRAAGRTDGHTVDYALESMVPAAQGKGFDVKVTHIYPPVEVTDPTKEQ